MIVMREGKSGFVTTKFNPSRIKPVPIEEDQFQDKPHDLQNLAQKVTEAFAKAEQDNDDMITKTRNSIINETTSSIIQAEKSNEMRLKKMINALPKYESHVSLETPFDLNILSLELASHMR